jgi:undecaprenyl pyrophosphate synthase
MEGKKTEIGLREAKSNARYMMSMIKACNKVCVDYKGKKEMTENEKNCLDRCAAKYLMVSDFVNKVIEEEKREAKK